MDSIPDTEIDEEPPHRGKFFAIYLAILVILKIWGIFSLFQTFQTLLVYAFNLSDLGFIIALYYWKKWAVYSHMAWMCFAELLLLLFGTMAQSIFNALWIASGLAPFSMIGLL